MIAVAFVPANALHHLGKKTKKEADPEGTGLESFRRGCLKGPFFVQLRTDLCK
jgi:hypothetical protein